MFSETRASHLFEKISRTDLPFCFICQPQTPSMMTPQVIRMDEMMRRMPCGSPSTNTPSTVPNTVPISFIGASCAIWPRFQASRMVRQKLHRGDCGRHRHPRRWWLYRSSSEQPQERQPVPVERGTRSERNGSGRPARVAGRVDPSENRPSHRGGAGEIHGQSLGKVHGF
jgi:hypothetical protein